MASERTKLNDFANVEVVAKPPSVIRNGQKMQTVRQSSEFWTDNDILLTEHDFAALYKGEAIHVIMQDEHQVWLRFMVQ